MPTPPADPQPAFEEDAVERIYRALIDRELADEDLSARRIASFLGKTTGAIYHRWVSIDALLFAVSQRGFAELRGLVEATYARTRDFADCGQAYVEFGLDHPELYPLMFERRFDWDALRRSGAFERATPGSQLLGGVVCLLEASGSSRAMADTRLLMAGLHGIVSFAATGRMNAGELSAPDREIAIASARDLASRIAPPQAKAASPKTAPSQTPTSETKSGRRPASAPKKKVRRT